MSVYLSIVALAGLALGGGDGPFRAMSFEAACEAAKDEGKIVFVDFYTTWCPPCKKLDQITWKDERVRAYVELRRGARLAEAELHDWLSTRLAKFKQPREIIFVDEMPRLANAKLDRVALGEWAKQEVETA